MNTTSKHYEAPKVPAAATSVVPSKTAYWIGHALSAFPVLMLFASGAMKLAKPDFVVKGMVEEHGYPESIITGLGVVELTCTVLYLIPQTSVLGAILTRTWVAVAPPK